MRKILTVLLLSGIGVSTSLVGCADGRSPLSVPQSSTSTLITTPETAAAPPNFLSLLRRKPGQTEFLSLDNLTFRDGRESAPPAREERGGGPREVQESDIFRVAPGKMLYLLNSYRGLQAVSFAKGEARAELLGRVFPEKRGVFRDLYLDRGPGIVYVLSSHWAPESTRITAYDVSDPAHLHAVGALTVEGTLADARRVGDVVYLATRAERDGRARGLVSSLRLRNGLEKVDTRTLTLTPDAADGMSIVEVKEGGQSAAYLLATREDSSGGLGRRGAVEVLDLSSPDGKIRSLMTAWTAGTLESRGSWSVKDGTLVVVSSVLGDGPKDRGSDEDRRLTVAVEAFAFPTKQSRIISESEESARQARLAREIARLEKATPDPAARAAEIDALMANPVYGLAGVFVRNGGTLRKSVADRRVTLTADRDGSARVKDVKWSGGTLYVLWTPLDRTIFFDVVDVAHPRVGLPRRGRLALESWVERGTFVTQEGRSYVLGLGWIEPSGERRHPMARLFEITTMGDKLSLVDRATPVLKAPEVFANFATGEKFIEVSFRTPLSGDILFEASMLQNGQLRDGGQLIHFDLTKPEAPFAPGPMLVGDSAWLRRVFVNPDLGRVQAFSDEALVTFGGNSGDRTAEALQVLELARNIVGFASLPYRGGSAGVQIVSRADYIPSGNGWSSTGSVELRLTRADQPDAEAGGVLSTLKLEGGFYAEHLIVDGKLLIVTESSSFDEREGRGTSVRRIHLVAAKESGLAVIDSRELVESTGRDAPPLTIVGRSLLRNGREIWLATGTGLSSVTVEDGIVLRGIDMDSCKFRPEAEVTLVSAGERSALFVREKLELKVPPFVEPASARVTRNFLVPLRRENQRASCGDRVNIPGEPLAYAENFVISKDDEYQGYEAVDGDGAGDARKFYEIRSTPALTVTRLSKVATLTESKPDSRVDEVMPVGDALLRLGRAENGTAVELEVIGVDGGRLRRRSQTLSLPLDQPVLGPIFRMNEAKLGVFISSSWTEEALLFGFESGELTPIPLRAPGKVVPGKLFLPGFAPKAHYDRGAKTLVISAGLYGNLQYSQ